MLHHETIFELADALATEPGSLHAWVSAESDRTHPLPDAFREIWGREVRKGEHRRQRQRQQAEGGGAELELVAGEQGATLDRVQGTGEQGTTLDAESLQARLRQRMRDTMHATMQQESTSPLSSQLISAHLISSHLISSHLIPSHLI